MYKHECKRCGYKWKGKKQYPVSCPKCKRYDWNKEDKNAKEKTGC